MCSWNAAELLRRIDAGEFDHNLSTELKKLTTDQLSELCELMAKRHADADGHQTRKGFPEITFTD